MWTTVALDLVGFGIVVPILGGVRRAFRCLRADGRAAVHRRSRLAQFVCAPLLGRLSDRVGRKPVIVVSLLGTAVGSFVTGAASTLWLLFLGRILDGASGASISVAQAAVGDMASPSERPRLIGLLGAAFGVGFVIGPRSVAWRRSADHTFRSTSPACIALGQRGRRRSCACPRRGARSTVDVPAVRVACRADLRRLAVVGFITGVLVHGLRGDVLPVRQAPVRPDRGEHLARVPRASGLVLVVMQGGVYHQLARRTAVGPAVPGRGGADRCRARVHRDRHHAGRCWSSRWGCSASARAWPTRRSPRSSPSTPRRNGAARRSASSSRRTRWRGSSVPRRPGRCSTAPASGARTSSAPRSCAARGGAGHRWWDRTPAGRRGAGRPRLASRLNRSWQRSRSAVHGYRPAMEATDPNSTPVDPKGDHDILEAFNAEETVTDPGRPRPEPDTTDDADAPAP